MSSHNAFSRPLVIVLIVAVVAVIGYMVFTRSGGLGAVRDQTNDETEVVPS